MVMPARVYTARERSFDRLEHVAIAITLLRRSPGQQHVGILHKDESLGEVRMLHLLWHNRLGNAQPEPSYAWIVPPIPRRRARQVAAFCRNVHRANPSGIPYAFSQASDCFNDQTGAFLMGTARKGLTCATFVLGVFHSTGLPLIQYETWPTSREGDEQWQRHIIEELKAGGAPLQHIRDVESEVGSVRYRPEDVAGGAAAGSIPAPFAEADPLAQAILARLRTEGLST